jgi:hypothetical protein
VAELHTYPEPADLRERLLGNLPNVELRQKYLATRTPRWTQADLRLANERLLAARVVRGLIGFAVVGAVGGAIGDMLFARTVPATTAVATPVLVGAGSVVSGAVSFGLLGAFGQVVVSEIVGEEWESAYGRGVPALFARFGERIMEILCGATWGAICGLLIGALAWAADAALGLPRVGALDRVLAGAVGGVLLGLVFSVLVIGAVGRREPGAAARRWAALGPLPMVAYFFSVPMARQHYLRK